MKLLWGSDIEDYGSSGIYMYDLNQDGRLDILYSNGSRIKGIRFLNTIESAP